LKIDEKDGNKEGNNGSFFVDIDGKLRADHDQVLL